MLDFHLSRFAVDASPPSGHPLCGGWIQPVIGQDDPLSLRGVLIQGAGLPIVLATLDWTGVGDESYIQWVERIAESAGTTPDRVALHCVHQHNAPFIDQRGNERLKAAGASPLLFDPEFVKGVMRRGSAALQGARKEAIPFNRIRVGQATVDRVACNRRVIGPDGKIKFTRTSSTRDPAARAEPDGTIDPILRSISFLHDELPLARLYWYTTHPMSYYGDGRVSADFVGLARSQRDHDEPEVAHLYFTGCAGNVTAGKYNDGSHENRAILADRVYQAMKSADLAAEDHPVDSIAWRTLPFQFGVREDLDAQALDAIVRNPNESTVNRNRSAMTLGWIDRVQTGRPILLGALDLGAARTLHLPGETFVEYQLFAQSIDPDRPLAVAAYGDGGPWYIPLARSYDEGGYEPSVSWVAKDTEMRYREAIRELLGPA